MKGDEAARQGSWGRSSDDGYQDVSVNLNSHMDPGTRTDTARHGHCWFYGHIRGNVYGARHGQSNPRTDPDHRSSIHGHREGHADWRTQPH